MKIIVDEMPKTHQECPFAKYNCEYGWYCSLRRAQSWNEEMCIVSECEWLQNPANSPVENQPKDGTEGD